MSLSNELASFVSAELARRADPTKALSMAAYMKTDMPFYGVQSPELKQILGDVKQRFELRTRRDYESCVKALWRLPHREEKILAIRVARMVKDRVVPDSLPLYERIIREGAWWDLVDETAIHLVGKVLLQHREETAPLMDEWLEDSDMWIRRTALLCQIGHKGATDHRRLFRYCRSRAAEKEFFIRKAIGWALRDYSYAEPERVARFVEKQGDRLSGLSVREALKALRRGSKN